MNPFEKYLHSHKFVFVCLSIISLPFVLIWSFIYGLTIAIIGVTVARYEFIRNCTYRDTIEKLKYPKWKTQEYIKSYLSNVTDIELRRKAERAFEEKRKAAPGILGNATQNIFLGILYYPPLLIWGTLNGPIRAFSKYSKWWYRTYHGISFKKEVI